MPQINRRATRAVINLDHVAHNLQFIKKLTGSDKKICVAVKADGYGHGAVEIARKCLDCGVSFLAVATVNEAVHLREAGINAPIILFSFAIKAEIPDLVQYGLSPFVGDPHYVSLLNAEAASQGRSIKVHLKIDTGMGRIGVSPENAVSLAKTIQQASHLTLEGCCTHFPVSDSTDEGDIAFTEYQIRLFSSVTQNIRKSGINPGILHAANSGAILSRKDSHFDMVRPGICLYGYYPDPGMRKNVKFKPVMQLVSRVSFLKTIPKGTSVSYGRTWYAQDDTLIATIPVGYGDGFNRLLSNRGRVLIKGKSYPIVGRICMDQFMVDLGRTSDVSLNDEVIVFGYSEGAMSAENIAVHTGTIPYEVTCNINKRVPRDYLERNDGVC